MTFTSMIDAAARSGDDKAARQARSSVYSLDEGGSGFSVNGFRVLGVGFRV